ncbi:unnamed protein product [Bursaphelenchus okinawaensis]|uniref:Rap guanine nucleotide exchange factor 4 n=1 Tax=Bursaphelenchus okinawaensis TaxID=465554 RepID=A0A811KLU4_9BILA|nr:unnamed protein product [Bursaphelenchus okinawaensis]CAG9104884.1 unnamed protein product [Bursaphelenchus okinawaensis]
MDTLLARIRRIRRLNELSDTFLLHLLANTDYVPDRVAAGVILFQQGEVVSYWYLLLSGEVELYLPSDRETGFLGQHLTLLTAGALFGELNLYQHCCSARVHKSAEFVRLNQTQFLSLYSKHADHLQPYITVMEDIPSTPQEPIDPEVPEPTPFHLLPKPNKKSPETNGTSHPNYALTSVQRPANDVYDFGAMTSELLPDLVAKEVPFKSNGVNSANPLEATGWEPPVNLFELSSSLTLDARIMEAGQLIKRVMYYRAPNLIRERQMRRGDKTEIFHNAMSGAEITSWLYSLWQQCTVNPAKQPTRIQMVGIWQTLLDNQIISHITNEEQFKDKHVFYKWTIANDMFEDYFINRLTYNNMQFMPNSELVEMPDPYSLPPPGCEAPSDDDLLQVLFFLSTIGLDSLFKIILTKPPHERSNEELELVFEELLHVKALSHLSTMVKKELARVIGFEQHQHAGTVLFHQGSEGQSWYIILKGSVDVSIAGKGVVCTLQEGDDFGKLALVNDAPRAATITLRDDNSQFLRVDKENFNRILRDVEANTVRLKEHGQDVLVLERINLKFDETQPVNKNQCCYSVMAGLPEKMIEYVLETRIDALTSNGTLDTFLEDFILTHIIFMPSNILCNYLKNYYATRGDITTANGTSSIGSNEIINEKLTAKRRVITFITIWEFVLGIHFFLDPVANSFVEEMYCSVIEDANLLPNMESIVHQISRIRRARENVMIILSRHPTCVLDCGVYSSDAPAPNPILPIDVCNQCIYFSDATMITLSVRMNKSASDIVKLTRGKVHFDHDDLYLVEVKSNGERVVYSPAEISVTSMISLNGRLYVVTKEEINSLTSMPNQAGPTEPPNPTVLEMYSSSDLAHQLMTFHGQLFEATDEIELIFQVIGRNKFSGRSPTNLDILLRRFNEIQFWTTTEVLLSPTTTKRVANLRKLIKTAVYAKTNKDLMSLFAITLGLSNIAVSRLVQLWDKLPSKLRRQYAEFEALLDPSRNHRAYRLLVAKMEPPVIPFVPLLLKDLTFMHEGNKTYFGALVNFEKMHMIANVLRNFKGCKSRGPIVAESQKKVINNLIRFVQLLYVAKCAKEMSTLPHRIDGSNLILSEFCCYIARNEPVIISNAIEGWKAFECWVKPDGNPNWRSLKKVFGNVQVPVTRDGKCDQTKVNFDEFIGNLSSDANCPFYLKDWHFCQCSHEKWYHIPDFLKLDWVNNVKKVEDEDVFRGDYRFCYIGGSGTWTGLHSDVMNSYSWSANICGRKRWIMLPKAVTKIGNNLLEEIEDIRKEDWKSVGGIEFEQIRGEIVFVPFGWYHQVHNEGVTISINHNWCNHFNVKFVIELMFQRLKDVIKEVKLMGKDADEPFEMAEKLLRDDYGLNLRNAHKLLDIMLGSSAEELHLDNDLEILTEHKLICRSLLYQVVDQETELGNLLK